MSKLNKSDQMSIDVVPPTGAGIFRRLNKDHAGRGTTGGVGLGDLIEVFQPTRHHLVAEAERQKRDIVQRPSTDKPFGPIDLASGKVTIN
jgi:hypothetical protein